MSVEQEVRKILRSGPRQGTVEEMTPEQDLANTKAAVAELQEAVVTLAQRLDEANSKPAQLG